MNSMQITFNPIANYWLIITCLMFLVGFLAFLEWRRQTKWFTLRLLASLLICISVAGLLLQPNTLRRYSANNSVLLTRNYDKGIVDSLTSTNVYTFFKTPDAADYKMATVVSEPELFNEKYNYVIGDGLPEYVLHDSKIHFSYLTGKLPLGIVDWKAPEIYEPNNQNYIRGAIHIDCSTKLILQNTAGKLDSISFSKPGVFPFKFTVAPKQSGLFIYSLSIENKNGTEVSKFPVEVEEADPLRILFLQQYPSVEIRTLKNFLTKQHHKLITRTQLSKNNFKLEFNNWKQFQFDQLTPQSLDSLDLVILTSETSSSISQNELTILSSALMNGLGVVKLMDASESKSTQLSLALKTGASDTVQLTIAGEKFTFPVAPFTTVNDLDTILASNNRVLSGFITKGLGKLGFQFLQETYRLALEDKEKQYASIWSPLLQNVSRFKNKAEGIRIKNHFPVYVDEPIYFDVISSTVKTPNVSINNTIIPLIENIMIDDYYHGKVWAANTGWNSLVGGHKKKNFYVSDLNEWQALRIVQQQKINQVHSKKQSASNAPNQVEQRPIKLLFFFLLFVLGFGFLWLAPKL